MRVQRGRLGRGPFPALRWLSRQTERAFQNFRSACHVAKAQWMAVSRPAASQVPTVYPPSPNS
eukprot:5792885-Prymnesium_polylepis.1